jgi:hypothetical protein
MSIGIMIAFGGALLLGAAAAAVAMINREVNASLAAIAPATPRSIQKAGSRPR